MTIAGIICEYNPFHNGHARHIALTREATGCGAVVCVMSGSFTQRGEPALLSKWQRARMALGCGADVVVELPTLFAAAPADRFALGGVYLLRALGADFLSFGSELPDMDRLRRLAKAHDAEDEGTRAEIAAALARVESLARARGAAIARAAEEACGALDAPNTALAIAYLRAITQLDRDAAGYKPITPVAIARNSSYHSEELGVFASASAIRAALYRGGQESTDAAALLAAPGVSDLGAARHLGDFEGMGSAVPSGISGLSDHRAALHHSHLCCAGAEAPSTASDFIDLADASSPAAGPLDGLSAASETSLWTAMPPFAASLLRELWPRRALDMRLYDAVALALLRALPGEQFPLLPGAAEGLGNLIRKHLGGASGVRPLIESVKTKRYTWARISRMLAHALLDIDEALVARHPLPEYARVLGVRRDALPLLRGMKDASPIPLVTDAAGFAATKNEAFAADIRATDLWGLFTGDATYRAAGRDMTHPMMIVKD